MLCGIRLGTYGRDGVTLAGLLREMRRLPIPRVRLSSLEPMDVTDTLLGEIADHPTLCHHLHLPLQSGDDEVLDSMYRIYRREDFTRLVTRLREAWPEAALTTDVIVGFPGETEEQFARSLAFVAEQRFTRVHVFPFSPRSGTPAADLPDLPAEVKRARAAQMLELGERLAQEAAEAWVGKRVRVLCEGRDGDGLLNGLTEHYVRVRWSGAGNAGEVVEVVPTEAIAGELRA